MTHDEIVKYTDHLLAEFYKDCPKQLNKEKRQVDIVLTDGDFSTLQNIMCEAIVNNQNQMLDKVCDLLYAMLTTQDINDYDYVTAPAYDNVMDFVEDFRKSFKK